MANVRVRLRFLGEVQGVGFRHFVRTRSYPLRVGGFVQNRPDGTVVAELEGDSADVHELERVVREEHPHARVDRVERVEVPLRGSAPPVEIL